ncbi:nuclear nucleic acid-binding protein C1D [Tanacetum coccineum]|uniref:Nuclear nucleic acid-binding protein C1D n=1 Tax=Tanacetum coccineum TaxID=301880 RepID=A0ABQ4YVP5_9ASTR
MAESSSAVPEPVLESINRTSSNMKQFQTQFNDVLLPLLNDQDFVNELKDPLQKAHFFMLLAKATTTLYTMKLRCNGVDPDDHPVRSELEVFGNAYGNFLLGFDRLDKVVSMGHWERLRLHQEKLDKFINLSNAPLRPSTTLNYQAATRFIEHSLPDLTRDQKKSMREISRREVVNREGNVSKRRKYLSSSKKSVKTAAEEFLEKASRELLGDNKGSVKGPFKLQDSDEDDDMIPSAGL